MEQKPKILLLEDLQNWQDSISRLLILNDYDVVTASSLDAAIDLLRAKTFDVAVVDIRLNEGDVNNMDGIVFLDEIEKYYLEDRTHVIMLSGHATTKHAIDALERPTKIVTKFFLKEEIDNDKFISEVARTVRMTEGDRESRDEKIFRTDLPATFYNHVDIPLLIQQLMKKDADQETAKDFKLIFYNLLLPALPLAYKKVENIQNGGGNNEVYLLFWSRKDFHAIGLTITLASTKEPSSEYWDRFGQTEIIKRSSSKFYKGIAVKLRDMEFQDFLSA
ncbi:MAG: response regulator [bacterium]|nr:response regulator [bacterium]